MIESVATKDRILDTAEKLFGVHGFEATSLRDITTEARANLASVNYHFQTKDSLIEAVIARRIEPINRRRLELLDAAGPHPPVEQVLRAFLQPVLEVELTPSAPLMGRILAEAGKFVERVFRKYVQHVSQRFVDALAEALPDLSREELLWRFHFMIGLMTHILCWGPHLPGLTGGLCSLADREALIARAVQFLRAGFAAPPVAKVPPIKEKQG